MPFFSLDLSFNPREETVQKVGRNKGGFPWAFDYIILSNIRRNFSAGISNASNCLVQPKRVALLVWQCIAPDYRQRGIPGLYAGYSSHVGYMGEIATGRGIKGAPCIRRKESMD